MILKAPKTCVRWVLVEIEESSNQNREHMPKGTPNNQLVPVARVTACSDEKLHTRAKTQCGARGHGMWAEKDIMEHRSTVRGGPTPSISSALSFPGTCCTQVPPRHRKGRGPAV